MAFELSEESWANARLPEVPEQPTMDVTLAELERLKKHRNGALSPNTVRSYMTGISQWKAWAHQQNKTWFPAKPEHLALWLSDLGVGGVKATTMKQRLKGVGYLHREQDGDDPTQSELVKEAVAFWSFNKVPTKKAVPVTSQTFQKLLDGTSRRDTSLLLVMRWSMLRPSEAADLRWGDLDKKRGLLCVRRSKTDQEGKGAWFNLPDQCWHSLDDLWLYRRGWARLPESRVFLLSATSVSRRIRLLGIQSGMSGISGHSLRRGMAVDLVHRGESIPEIMAAGRWKSPEMVARYTEEAATSGALARYAEEDQYEF